MKPTPTQNAFDMSVVKAILDDRHGDKARIEELEARIEELEDMRRKDFEAYLEMRYPTASSNMIDCCANHIDHNDASFAFTCDVELPDSKSVPDCDKCQEDIEHTHGTRKDLIKAYRRAKMHI